MPQQPIGQQNAAWWGQSLQNHGQLKRSLSFGQQRPIPSDTTLDKAMPAMSGAPMSAPSAPNTAEHVLYSAETQAPVHRSVRPVEMTHRHAGHHEDHPVGYRHTKESADPMHGQEDKLFDEYRGLHGKASRGECSAMDLARLREIQGSLESIQHQRFQAAQAIISGKSQQQHEPRDLARPHQQMNEAAGVNPNPLPASMHNSAMGQPSPTAQSYRPPTQQPSGHSQNPLQKEANETGAPSPMPTAGGFDPTAEQALTPEASGNPEATTPQMSPMAAQPGGMGEPPVNPPKVPKPVQLP